MTLTEQQITDNYKELRKIINDTFSGLRLDKLNHMYDDLEDRMVVAPASSVEHYHNSKVGGYVEHILHVIKFSQQIKEVWENAGATIDFTDEELVFAAMHHDLGKCGDELGNEFYTPNESEWHIKNQGKIYNVNPDIEHMDVTDRSFFLLQDYGIKYSKQEFYGIRLADGMYVKANEAYLKTSMPTMMLRTHLPIIIHQADMMATYYERDMWKNGNKIEAKKVEQSVSKIKGAVGKQVEANNEVKEKFNTKTTDAKDIFNELFGEKK